jgi:hypothetical protein
VEAVGDEPQQKVPARREGRPKKRWHSRFGSIFAWASNLTLIFSALSTLASLETWDDVDRWLAGLGEQLVAIVGFMGRAVHTLLIPWVYLRDLAFRLVPLRIPDDWEDPVLLGMFIIWLPLYTMVFGWMWLSKQFVQLGGERLEQTIIASALELDRKRQADLISDQVDKLSLEALAIGPIADLLRALKREDFPEDLLTARAERALKDVADWRQRVREGWAEAQGNWANERRGLVARALLAGVLLLALSLDQVLNGGGFVAFSVLWRSAVVFVVFGIAAAVFGALLIPLIAFVMRPVTRVLLALPGAERQLRDRFLPWLMRQTRGLDETSPEEPSADPPEKSAAAVAEAPILAADEFKLTALQDNSLAGLAYFRDAISLSRIQRVERELDSGRFYSVHEDGSRHLLIQAEILPEYRSTFRRLDEIQLYLLVDEVILDSTRVPLQHFWMG